jgi:hypothetical protein
VLTVSGFVVKQESMLENIIKQDDEVIYKKPHNRIFVNKIAVKQWDCIAAQVSLAIIAFVKGYIYIILLF